MPGKPIKHLPDKLYFKIGEVSKLAGVPPYVLRFWETEFACIRPKRTPAGQRLYRKVDVETILEIQRLLHEKKFTIKGARQHLTARKGKPPEMPPEVAEAVSVEEIRSDLLQIRALLTKE